MSQCLYWYVRILVLFFSLYLYPDSRNLSGKKTLGEIERMHDIVTWCIDISSYFRNEMTSTF